MDLGRESSSLCEGDAVSVFDKERDHCYQTLALTAHLPRIAISWILRNDCTSNVQLAVMSNVCLSWREVALEVVAMEAFAMANVVARKTRALPSARASSSSLEMTDQAEKDAMEESSGASIANPLPNTSLFPIRNLLITDMAREMVVRQNWFYHNKELTADRLSSATASATVASSVVPAQDEPRHYLESNNIEGNFCLAWFAPSGIQITSVPVAEVEEESTSDNGGHSFKYDFASGVTSTDNLGGDSLMGNGMNGQQRQQRLLRKCSSVSAGQTVNVACSHEWRGYRHAAEVLVPLGYATDFIRVRLSVASFLI